MTSPAPPPAAPRSATSSVLRLAAAAGVAAALIAGASRGVRAWTLARAVDRLDSPDALERDTSEQRLRLLDDTAPVADALGHERPAVRRSIVWILAARGADGVPHLRRALTDADAGVRLAACDALGSLPGADDALVAATRDPAAAVRRSATASLAAREVAPADGEAAWRVAAVRAVGWLRSRQSEDGGWHGAAYGVFEDGRSTTPFVLDVLLGVPADVETVAADVVQRAFGFMDRERPEDSAFPTYAVSLALRCVVRARPDGWRARAASLADWLRRAQFAEPVGCPPEDLAYGAWGLDAAKPGLFARADLSATCFALGALREAGVPPDDAMFRRARVFVDRCHNAAGDGGFFLSTNSPEANKAGGCGEFGVPSYGSATSDGALAREALAGTPDPAALRWLVSNPEATRTPGFTSADAPGWDLGVMYYYAAERSRLRDALRRAGDAPARAWEDGIRRILVERQRADGSWANPVPLMREDEPLVATGLALQAIVRLGAP